jgi:sugar transferase EpsL
MESLPASHGACAPRHPHWLKRFLDAAVAVLALLVLSPVLAAVTTLVLFGMGWPVLFRQRRTGESGRFFEICKFRTMKPVPEGGPEPLVELRITRVGHLLRCTSLDELPQLWNVLKGDMSLVGPRPLLPKYLPRYTAHQMRRHEVKPGITGWAQVNGRNGLSWKDKFDLDVWYVDHWSFWLDIRILALTVWRVLRCDGISQTGHAAMPEFLGTCEQKRPV